MNQIWNYNHWFLSVLLSTRPMLWPMSYSPSFLDGRCLNVLSLKTISRVAWNFRLSFRTCKQHFLRNILTHESIKSEVIVVLQVFVLWKKITLVQGCHFWNVVIIFWNSLIFYQIFLHHKWNRLTIFVIKMVKTSYLPNEL